MTDVTQGGAELRVLVLAPTSRDAILTRSILERAGIASAACSSVAQICREVKVGAGAVLKASKRAQYSHM